MFASGTSLFARLVHVSTEEFTVLPAAFIPFPGVVSFLTVFPLPFNHYPGASGSVTCGELDWPPKLRDMRYADTLTRSEALMERGRFFMSKGRFGSTFS